jgi:hypothetical protein
MHDLPEDISRLICQPLIDPEMDQIRINGRMLQLLMLLDGKSSMAEISSRLGRDLDEIRETTGLLLEAGLIHVIGGQEPVLSGEFFDFVTEKLAMIAGPIARLMVEDAIYDLGGDGREISRSKGVELIDIFSRQIPDDEQRAAFIKVMMEKLTS